MVFLISPLRNIKGNPFGIPQVVIPVLVLIGNALTSWERKTGDMGGIPEPELVKRLWPPDGVQHVMEA